MGPPRRNARQVVAFAATICACQGLLLAACSTRAPAPPTAPPGTPLSLETAFRAADQDRDGLVSEAELARDSAAAFAALDADPDGFLTPAELAGAPAESLPRLDISGDGRLSFAEVMADGLDHLAAADADDDGALSLAELTASPPAAAPTPLPGPGLIGGLATSLLDPPAPSGSTTIPADPAARRRVDYERQGALQDADLQRRQHARRLYEQWRQQAGGGVAGPSQP